MAPMPPASAMGMAPMAPVPVGPRVVAIYPFKSKGDVKPEFARELSGALAKELGGLSSCVQMMPPEQLTALVSKYTQDPLCQSQACQMELATAWGASIVIRGEIVGLGADRLITLSMTDLRSSFVLFNNDLKATDKDAVEKIRAAAGILAKSLACRS